MSGSQRSVRHAAAPHRGRRVLVALGIAMALVVVVAGAGAAVVWHRLQGNITAKDVIRQLGPDRPTAPAPSPGQDQPAENILVMGSDTRAGDNSVYGSGIQGARSDTVVLVHLSAGRTRADLVSIPRDSVVDIPECYLDNGKTLPPTRNRFNDAYSRGGPACSIRTVEQLTQIRVDHYVVVDFEGFSRMVDALGGVDVCVPKAVHDPKAKLTLDAGRQHVDGTTALAYARARYTLGDGSDLGRIDRQQALMSSMVQRVQSAGVLLRPDRLLSFLDAATKSITTDPGLASLNELRKVAQSLQGLQSKDISFTTVPWIPDPANPQATVVWKEPAADQLWTDIREDKPIPGTPAAAAAQAAAQDAASPTGSPTESAQPPLKTRPAAIRVSVVNASGTPGVGTTVADQLRAQGFQVVSVSSSSTTQTGTVVRRSPVYDESGRTLLTALPGATEEVTGTSSVLEVVVGDASQQVATVDASRFEGSSPSSSASPSGSPSSTLASRTANQDICS